MDELNQISNTLALSMGAAWASGINLYATLMMLGVLSATGNMTLPPELQILANPLVIGAATLMFIVEFVADKMPGVDTGWDSIHTFIRIPAGAMLAAGAVGDVNQAMTLSAAIVGGGLAASSHAFKSGSRVMINTSPEPFSNWLVSVAEDITVLGGIWLAVQNPVLFLVLLLFFIVLMVWLLPKLWKFIKIVFTTLGRLFKPSESPSPSQDKKIEPPSQQ
ncbi:MAG: DUF4126 domain-containing protein [Thermodesulfobacteriota bacterium]|nr:DUF4126 domain-containing protein [Thermodesulfobacteriota bacterium]